MDGVLDIGYRCGPVEFLCVSHKILGNYCKECYVFRLLFLFILICFADFSSVFLIP
jgi:hypothetical protein